MNNNLKKILGYGFAIAFAWVASFGSANAILVKGHIDPPFGVNGGGIDANLGWSADMNFNVDSSCLTDGTHLCNITGLTVTGTLYDATPPPPDVLLDSNVNYLQNQSPIPTQFLLTISGGLVTGIDTGPIGFYSASNALFTGNIWVEFSAGDGDTMAQLIAALCPPIITTSETNTFWSRYGHSDCNPVSGDCSTDPNSGTTRSAFGVVTITQIPEPATALLLLGALASGWIVRRRSA